MRHAFGVVSPNIWEVMMSEMQANDRPPHRYSPHSDPPLGLICPTLSWLCCTKDERQAATIHSQLLLLTVIRIQSLSFLLS